MNTRTNTRMTWGAFLAMALMALSSVAQADELDFTNPFVWSGVDGKINFTTNVNGIQVTVSAGPGIPESTLSQSLFGLGVDWSDGILDLDEGVPISQELDSLESLTVTFDRPVVVTSFKVSSFFKIGFGFFNVQTENAGFFYRNLNDISQGARFDANGNLLGNQTIMVPNPQATYAITWVANSNWNSWLDTAYALQSLTYTPQ